MQREGKGAALREKEERTSFCEVRERKNHPL